MILDPLQPPARRIIVAPDSFKGSVGARAAADAIAAGWLAERPQDDVVSLPMADGGEGTLDVIASAVRSSVRMPVEVDGPDGRPVKVWWLLLPDGSGVVELAQTSGITLIDQLAPLDAHTVGFGQAIAAASAHGVKRLVLAVGGSASTDGGAGALMAMGARFLTAAGLSIGLGGRGLQDLDRIELSMLPSLPAHGAVVLTDVINPLCGPRGAAAIFGPQKGATSADVGRLDNALARLAARAEADPDEPGVGAAGGTAYGLRMWGATIVPGAGYVASVVGLPAALATADLVITGEGRYDGQSEAGKAPSVVLGLAQAASVRTALVAGDVQVRDHGFVAAVALTDLAGSATAAIAQPVRFLQQAGRMLASAL